MTNILDFISDLTFETIPKTARRAADATPPPERPEHAALRSDLLSTVPSIFRRAFTDRAESKTRSNDAGTPEGRHFP